MSRAVRSKNGAKNAASWRLSEKTSRLRPPIGGASPTSRGGSASRSVCAATAAKASSPGWTEAMGSRWRDERWPQARQRPQVRHVLVGGGLRPDHLHGHGAGLVALARLPRRGIDEHHQRRAALVRPLVRPFRALVLLLSEGSGDDPQQAPRERPEIVGLEAHGAFPGLEIGLAAVPADQERIDGPAVRGARWPDQDLAETLGIAGVERDAEPRERGRDQVIARGQKREDALVRTGREHRRRRSGRRAPRARHRAPPRERSHRRGVRAAARRGRGRSARRLTSSNPLRRSIARLRAARPRAGAPSSPIPDRIPRSSPPMSSGCRWSACSRA